MRLNNLVHAALHAWRRLMNRAGGVAAVVALIFMTRCIPYSPPSLVTNPDVPNDVHFPGILASLHVTEVINVLVIHGMGTHDDHYADGLMQELARQGRLHEKAPCTVVDTLTSAYGSSSNVLRCVLAADDGHELRLYVLVWSKLTEHFEQSILSDDWRLHGEERALLDRSLKEALIDKSFDDAIIYSGSFAPVMRASVKQALCAVLTSKDRPSPPCMHEDVVVWDEQRKCRHVRTDVAPIFMISHSLGSTMVVETLSELAKSAAEPETEGCIGETEPVSYDALEAKLFVSHTRAAYLLANQLPLIYLARIPKEPETVPANVSLAVAFAGRSTPLPLVAFNDPNDLLTFPFLPGWRDKLLPGEANRLRLLNVRVTNAHFRWAGVVVNPARAHTSYWTNADVVRLILTGN